MKCGGHCENVRLQMGHYFLKSHMFYIEMGGCHIVSGFECLWKSCPIIMNLYELYMNL
jgi:hypothetical protein